MPLQFRDKDVMWDSVKCFAQVQVDEYTRLYILHVKNNNTRNLEIHSISLLRLILLISIITSAHESAILVLLWLLV